MLDPLQSPGITALEMALSDSVTATLSSSVGNNASDMIRAVAHRLLVAADGAPGLGKAAEGDELTVRLERKSTAHTSQGESLSAAIDEIVSRAERDSADMDAVDEESEQWTISKFLDSVRVGKVISQALSARLPAGNDGSVELPFARALGGIGPERGKPVLHMLLKEGDTLNGMTNLIWQELALLCKQGAATATDLHDKFVQDGAGSLSFGEMENFLGGLERFLGAPEPDLDEAMRSDHCKQKDSHLLFQAGSYGIATTSATEYSFVRSPEAFVPAVQPAGDPTPAIGAEVRGFGAWPKEEKAKLTEKARPREPKAIGEFQGRINEISSQLQDLDVAAFKDVEFWGARLYTGPMYAKYNAVLRGVGEMALIEKKLTPRRAAEKLDPKNLTPPFLIKRFRELCPSGDERYPNRYVTTIHVINSAIVKLGQLMIARRVYRGQAGMVLPPAFWHKNEANVRGGIEFGFMSTTLNRSVAKQFSAGGAGFIFEMRMGMIDRGADLAWLSQYPHEKEILFAPLTGLEVIKSRVEGSTLVAEMRLSVNLMTPTIELVVDKMKYAHLHMLDTLLLQQHKGFQGASPGARQLGSEDGQLVALRTASQERPGAWFNDANNFFRVTDLAIKARRIDLLFIFQSAFESAGVLDGCKEFAQILGSATLADLEEESRRSGNDTLADMLKTLNQELAQEQLVKSIGSSAYEQVCANAKLAVQLFKGNVDVLKGLARQHEGEEAVHRTLLELADNIDKERKERVEKNGFRRGKKAGASGDAEAAIEKQKAAAAEAEGAEAAAEAEDAMDGGWTIAAWAKTCKLERIVKRAMLPSRERLKGASQLDYVRNLERSEVMELLEDAGLPGLGEHMLRELEGLRLQVAASAEELQGKFLQDGASELHYSSLDAFFGGLESIIGPANPRVREALEAEHTHCADSHVVFLMQNYGMETTAAIEWRFVTEPDNPPAAGWPVEAHLNDHSWHRRPHPLGELVHRLEEKNMQLRRMGEPCLLLEEAITARLYTGPMFIKYNAVLRGLNTTVPFLRDQLTRLCCENTYTTSIHCINSIVIKLGKLTLATKVFRGISGRVLPASFWQPNEFNVRGGVEIAFMSTVQNKSVAMAYVSGSSGPSVLLELHQSMISRGADLSFLSQYPHEREILFAPLTGLEVRATRIEGTVLVVEMDVTCNLSLLTIEQTLGQRRKMLHDMQRSMELQLYGRPPEVIRSFQQRCHEGALSREAAWYNEDENFADALQEVMASKRVALAEAMAPSA